MGHEVGRLTSIEAGRVEADGGDIAVVDEVLCERRVDAGEMKFRNRVGASFGRAAIPSATDPGVKTQDARHCAPVTAIVAWDPLYWQRLDFLFPHEDRKPMFEGKEKHAHDTAFRNSTLQGAYLMIAARAMGLDVGAMSGFSNEIVDQEFFSENGWKSNFLINMGYADETALFQKLPRFSFEDVCEIL